ncbi:hypothetical protein [Azospirillum sp. B510]|uniref:hypothetical protein n=1 Tax=Azospirillum sp. (strain B510) TaxID=137722 RepID=UPI0005A7BAD5|nr:hypothetical protein [Azospirillum sp. B510]
MDILLATNHLHDFTGSEVIILEFAEYFQSLGHRVRLFANWVGQPMQGELERRLGVTVENEPARIFPFDYDLAYMQHQVAGLFNYRLHGESKEKTSFVFGRLSRRSFLESGGWLHDRLLADRILANSVLTAEHLRLTGGQIPVSTFHNAAPAAFFRDRPSASGTLRTITIITNHADPSLMAAAGILSSRFQVRHIGKSGSEQRLVTPEMVHGSDLVISIGKSVQYALAARTPVFVYDHFGGPGYLDGSNFHNAASFSFSGRCCSRKLDADDLAEEIVRDYAKGIAFANADNDAMLRTFYLPDHLDRSLTLEPMSNRERQGLMGRNLFLIQERMMAEYVRSTYIEKIMLLDAIRCGE